MYLTKALLMGYFVSKRHKLVMLFILKNSCSKFGSKARESSFNEINNYCKLILMYRFSQSLRSHLRHSLYKRVFNKGGFQIPTTCLLQYLNTVRNGLHLAIVIVSKLLSLPANYAYPEVYEQTAVYNSSVGVFINTKKHILCIQLHKIFQVCGNV